MLKSFVKFIFLSIKDGKVLQRSNQFYFVVDLCLFESQFESCSSLAAIDGSFNKSIVIHHSSLMRDTKDRSVTNCVHLQCTTTDFIFPSLNSINPGINRHEIITEPLVLYIISFKQMIKFDSHKEIDR